MDGFLLVLLMIAACVAVGWTAKNGAEREARRREERWAQRPAMPGVAMPVSQGTQRPARSIEPDSRSSAPARSRPATSAAATPERTPSQAPARARPAAPDPVDINQAPAEELRNLPGVGVRAAERIVAHREKHGPFASVGDLEAVEGFDHHRVARLAGSAKV